MKTIFIHNGDSFNPVAESSINIAETLPPGNFIIQQNPQTEALYFQQIDPFARYTTVYGDMTKRCSRMCNTFQSRPNTTGILLTGEKGSGKTMLAKMLCTSAMDAGMPTIVINKAWVGDQFNALIQGIEQPAVILFDEFEKVYDSDEQELLLTLMDGVFPSKKMFIITCNNEYRVDKHMRNRPGRFFYALDFAGIGADVIRQYAAAELKPTLAHYIESLVQIGALFDQFNFDILKAVVEEMNRYDESPADALEMLNARPSGGDSTYNVVITKDKQLIQKFWPSTITGSPVGQALLEFEYRPDDTKSVEINFTPNDMVDVDIANNIYTYVNKDGFTAQITKMHDVKFNYKDLIKFS